MSQMPRPASRVNDIGGKIITAIFVAPLLLVLLWLIQFFVMVTVVGRPDWCLLNSC